MALFHGLMRASKPEPEDPAPATPAIPRMSKCVCGCGQYISDSDQYKHAQKLKQAISDSLEELALPKPPPPPPPPDKKFICRSCKKEMPRYEPYSYDSYGYRGGSGRKFTDDDMKIWLRKHRIFDCAEVVTITKSQQGNWCVVECYSDNYSYSTYGGKIKFDPHIYEFPTFEAAWSFVNKEIEAKKNKDVNTQPWWSRDVGVLMLKK